MEERGQNPDDFVNEKLQKDNSDFPFSFLSIVNIECEDMLVCVIGCGQDFGMLGAMRVFSNGKPLRFRQVTRG